MWLIKLKIKQPNKLKIEQPKDKNRARASQRVNNVLRPGGQGNRRLRGVVQLN
jgi:hypothetical protein